MDSSNATKYVLRSEASFFQSVFLKITIIFNWYLIEIENSLLCMLCPSYFMLPVMFYSTIDAHQLVFYFLNKPELLRKGDIEKVVYDAKSDQSRRLLFLQGLRCRHLLKAGDFSRISVFKWMETPKGGNSTCCSLIPPASLSSASSCLTAMSSISSWSFSSRRAASSLICCAFGAEH